MSEKLPRFPYAEHDNGVVLTQPRPGEFEKRPMSDAELAAREPALQIAKDIYRHANQAGVCYYEIWLLIAKAMASLPSASGWIACSERMPSPGNSYLVMYCRVIAVASRYKTRLDIEGWSVGEDDAVADVYRQAGEITHWMPLPAAPVSSTASKE